VGPLLRLDRHAVLAEHRLGESADEGPGQLDETGDARALDAERADADVAALLAIVRDVSGPQVERGALGVAAANGQGLEGVLRADGHDVAVPGLASGGGEATTALAAGQQHETGASIGPAARRVLETVAHLDPVGPGVVIEQRRPDPSHDAAVKE